MDYLRLEVAHKQTSSTYLQEAGSRVGGGREEGVGGSRVGSGHRTSAMVSCGLGDSSFLLLEVHKYCKDDSRSTRPLVCRLCPTMACKVRIPSCRGGCERGAARLKAR